MYVNGTLFIFILTASISILSGCTYDYNRVIFNNGSDKKVCGQYTDGENTVDVSLEPNSRENFRMNLSEEAHMNFYLCDTKEILFSESLVLGNKGYRLYFTTTGTSFGYSRDATWIDINN